jgi:hypothetical protein
MLFVSGAARWSFVALRAACFVQLALVAAAAGAAPVVFRFCLHHGNSIPSVRATQASMLSVLIAT